jgi:hypothetical protein
MQTEQYLLMCRSLTYAQRSARLLERAGITATVTRAPRTVSDQGCGYSVLISAKQGKRAMELLSEGELMPRRVLQRTPDGIWREVGYDLS